MDNRIKNIGIFALSIGLVGSILLNMLLYRESRKYYTQLYAAELDPLGLSYFQSESNQPPAELSKVVFFGDSRAAQWATPPLDTLYFINRGIGNQTSAQVAGRFEAHVKPFTPEIIIIQVGINDLKTIPLFPDRKQEIIHDCEANIKKIVQNSLDIDATVILTTIFPTSGDVPLARRPVWSADIYSAIEEVNSFILNFRQEGVIIFDTASILSDPDGNIKAEYVFDLLHLNNIGYETINLELVKILERLK